MPDAIAAVLSYHQRSKHHLHRYAASLGYLDWAAQPNPFRRYEGAPLLPLDEVPVTAEPTYDAVFSGSLAPRKLDRASISQFFYDSLALSAWKEYGENRWSLRVNPSSGNLHPTEGYLLAGPIAGLRAEAGLYHYAPHEHGLELRREISAAHWSDLGLPEDTFLVGLTTIHWREAWKYGERAFRYCQHDVGHAIGAVAVSAATMGWTVRPLESLSDDLLARVLGVSGQTGPEAEHPDLLLLVSARRETLSVGADALERLTREEPVGIPNQLSPEHEDWNAINDASEASLKPATEPVRHDVSPVASVMADRTVSARQIIRQRRSAVSFDGKTAISSEAFFRMLERVSPDANRQVFEAFPWRPSVHLALFVHRVDGLEPGLYFLLRDSAALEPLRQVTKKDYDWRPVDGAPSTVPLFELFPSDAGQAARTISCHQEIASESAFSLGMIADFEGPIRQHGAWFYKRLFWEAGAIGQMLYLEAEAAGVRGTGIGCFFDDVMHELLGFSGLRFQSLYHFTVGGPVEDARLRTARAYGHLKA